MRSSLYGGLMFVAMLSVGLVLAACGSSSSSTTSTTALTKAQFLVKGNAICAAGNKATNKIANNTFSKNKKPTQAQINEFAAKITPIIQGEINGVKNLGAPQGDQAKVNAIVNSAQSALNKIKADPTILASNQDPFKQANQLAKSYGLTACAGGGGGGGGGSSNG